MNKSDFWNYIETSKSESDSKVDLQIEILRNKLALLSNDEITSFKRVSIYFAT